MIYQSISKSKSVPFKFAHLIVTSTASCLLLVGSILLFPIFLSLLDGIYYSTSMFLIAFTLMLFEKIGEMLRICCSSPVKTTVKLNNAIGLLGWFTIFVGSVLGSPLFDFRNQKDLLYLIGFTILFFSNILKIIWTIINNPLPFVNIINKKFNSFFLQIFTILFNFFYLIGTMVFRQSSYRPSLILLAVPFYVFGAFVFFAANVFLYELYFGQQSFTSKFIETKTQIQQNGPSSELNQIKMTPQSSIMSQQRQQQE